MKSRFLGLFWIAVTLTVPQAIELQFFGKDSLCLWSWWYFV